MADILNPTFVIDAELIVEEELDADLGEFYGSSNPEYTGNYEVTPSLDTQTLPTVGKSMKRDVTVYPVPILEIPNSAGGITLKIC